jgi:hypothetical protein
MDFKLVLEMWTWFLWLRIRYSWGFCENGNEFSGLIKARVFLLDWADFVYWERTVLHGVIYLLLKNFSTLCDTQVLVPFFLERRSTGYKKLISVI